MCTVARIFIDGRRLQIKRTVPIGTLRLVRLVGKIEIAYQRTVPAPLQKTRTVQA